MALALEVEVALALALEPGREPAVDPAGAAAAVELARVAAGARPEAEPRLAEAVVAHSMRHALEAPVSRAPRY